MAGPGTGQMLAQLGGAIGELRGASRREEEREKAKAAKEKQGQEKQKLIDQLDQQGFGLQAQHLRAGGEMPASEIRKLQKGEKKTKHQKTFEQFSAYQAMSKQMNRSLDQAFSASMESTKTGDPVKMRESQEAYNTLAGSWEDKMKPMLASIDNTMKQYLVFQESQALDEALKRMPEENLSALDATFTSKMAKELGSEVNSTLEDLDEVDGVPIDLKGIPSNESIYNLSLTSMMKGTVTKDQVKLIMESTPEELLEHAKSEKLNSTLRAMAAALYKRRKAEDMLPQIQGKEEGGFLEGLFGGEKESRGVTGEF